MKLYKWTELTAENFVPNDLFNAHTIIYATADNTPVALTVGEQTVVGRQTGGNIAAIAVGIANNNIVKINGSVTAYDFAQFTATGITGLDGTELLAALSTVATSAFNWNGQNLTGIGTIASTGNVIITGPSGSNLLVYINADSTRAASLVINHGAEKLGTIQFRSGSVCTFMIADSFLATETLSFIPYIDNVAQTALTTTLDYNTGKWDFPADVEVSDDLVVGDDCDVVGDFTAGTIKADNGYSGTIPGPEAGKQMVFVKGVLTSYEAS